MEDELILSDKDRSKLDGIVNQMIENNEPDDNIQFVVNDFKGKYGVKKKNLPRYPIHSLRQDLLRRLHLLGFLNPLRLANLFSLRFARRPQISLEQDVL